MTQTTNQSEIASGIQLAFAPILEELTNVESILSVEMRSKHPFVDELVRYGCLLGGKRLRPALLLLTAKAVGQVCKEHYVLGAVVEMIHTATLVHDDVLDDADIRRHLATVNSRWDSESSILLGDFLFTHAFYLASTLDSTLACRLIGKSTNLVCEGEIRQKGSKAKFNIEEDEYTQIIDAKTAELCACSCQLGAQFTNASAVTVKKLERYGRYLGIAFQITDDLLDVVGSEVETGKSLGTDMKKQKPTLPLIRLLQVADKATREEVITLLELNNADHRSELLGLLEQHETLDYTRNKAQSYAQLAADQLDGLPESPALTSLQMLANFVVMRSR